MLQVLKGLQDVWEVSDVAAWQEQESYAQWDACI